MIRVLLLAVACLLAWAWGADAATLYADTTAHGAAGVACTTGSPCTVATAISQAVCGDTVNLKDGTYQGANDMLAVSSKSCSGSTVLTVQAVNDGAVRIDGQLTRVPCKLVANSYVTIKGFDCAYSDQAGATLWIHSGDHYTVQRMVSIDGEDVTGANFVGFLVGSFGCANPCVSDSLFEDIGVFGVGVETMLDYSNNARNIWRRIWNRGEGSNDATFGPGVANQMNYTDTDWPTPSLFENVIQLAAGSRGTIQYVGNPNRHSAQSPYIRMLGNIAYFPSGTSMTGAYVLHQGNPSCSGYLMQDLVVLSAVNGVKPLSLGDGSANDGKCDGSTVYQMQVTRASLIKTDTASAQGGATFTNVTEATTVAGTGFDYLGTGNTPKLCFQYVNGTYTTTPLWPWPMDDRIKAAIAVNSGNGSPALTGSAGTGYAAGTVTSEIASLLGAIPGACNSTVVPPPVIGPPEVSGQRTTKQQNNWATTTVAFPNDVTLNNLVVFIGGFWNASGLSSVTCSKSSGTATVGAFTTLKGSTGAAWAGGTGYPVICYAVVTGSGSLTLGLATNVGTATNTVSGTADEFTGVNPSSPLDANGSESTGTGTTHSASVTGTFASSLALAVMVLGTGETINLTWPGATQIYEDETGGFQPTNAGFLVLGVAGLYTATWTTVVDPDPWSAIAIAFRTTGTDIPSPPRKVFKVRKVR